MFGGSRPFMAKFEAKMKALVGKRDLESMKNMSATKFGRSYICRECYTLVKQAYDGIRKIQRSVAKSVQRVVLSVSGKGRESIATGEDDESSESESDQDLEIDYRGKLHVHVPCHPLKKFCNWLNHKMNRTKELDENMRYIRVPVLNL